MGNFATSNSVPQWVQDSKFAHISSFHLYLLVLYFQDTENSVMTNSTVDRKRRIASIFQHYYPEGGWGLVLLLSVVLVQEMSTNLWEFFTVPG